MPALQNQSSAIIIKRALNSARNVVPYDGLLHREVESDDTIIVNGATGYFGSAGSRRRDA